MLKIKTNKKFKVLIGILSIFAVIVLIFTISVLTRSSEPYIYPVPDNYDSLSLEEQKAVYSIPENVAKRLTTEALFKTILSNPFISEMYIPMGMDDVTYSEIVVANEERFRLIEFLGRLDCYEVMTTAYFYGLPGLSLSDDKTQFLLDLKMFSGIIVYEYKPFTYYYNVYFVNGSDQW